MSDARMPEKCADCAHFSVDDYDCYSTSDGDWYELWWYSCKLDKEVHIKEWAAYRNAPPDDCPLRKAVS